MDPMITPIVVILGKYALDKGADLAKEVGPKALETAKTMFQTVQERVGQKKPETAAEFPNDPEAYQKPLEKALEAEVQADPDLAAQLKALLEEYEKEVQAHAVATGQIYRATVKGSGAVAQDHSVATGEGGFAIKGDVHGDITVGQRKEPQE